jgi:hypothetical protein
VVVWVLQRAPFQHAAVGGTFDRLHSGHRNLLATAALVCVGTLYVGIAGDELLSAKANASFIEPFDAREAAVLAFQHAVRPSLHVVTKGLLNADPPLASTMEAVRVLYLALPCVRRCLLLCCTALPRFPWFLRPNSCVPQSLRAARHAAVALPLHVYGLPTCDKGRRMIVLRDVYRWDGEGAETICRWRD